MYSLKKEGEQEVHTLSIVKKAMEGKWEMQHSQGCE
jgi:hypothetical protein